MKLLTSLAVTIVLMAPVFAQTPTTTQGGTEVQVLEELNEAARMFRLGNFALAQLHSEKALLLDPQNRTAVYYLARTIHAQYRPGDDTAENVEKAREAIGVYRRILERVPGDDEPYKAIAYLLGAIKEDELQRQWIFQRAADASFTNDKRAEAYLVLASKYWDCSFKITELPTHKITTLRGTKAIVAYRMPKQRAEFDRAKECANRALEMVNMALTLMPGYEEAWAYKANILLELSKLAEMSGDLQQKREIQRQYAEAYNETLKAAKPSEPTP